MDIRLRLTAACLLGLLAACDKIVSPAEADPRPQPPHVAAAPVLPDQGASDFVNQSGADALFELRTADIAAARAKNSQVRAYAIMMAKDNAAAQVELKAAIAQSKDNLVPPTTLPDHLQSMLDVLSKGTARDFDKTYIEQQVEAHEDAVRLLTTYAQNGDVPAIKAAAGKRVAQAQAQLDQARSIEDALNKDL